MAFRAQISYDNDSEQLMGRTLPELLSAVLVHVIKEAIESDLPGDIGTSAYMDWLADTASLLSTFARDTPEPSRDSELVIVDPWISESGWRISNFYCRI